MRCTSDESFSPDEFRSPGAFYWPGYIWFWLCGIKPEDIREMLAEMDSVGAKSVWALPVPADFRPNAMPTSLKPDFLTEEFGELMGEYVRAAEELGMKVWLYDDGGWPSGSACGRIVRENPELAAESLGHIRIAANEPVKLPDRCLLAVLCRPDGSTEAFPYPNEALAGDLREKYPECELHCYHIRKHGPADGVYGAFPDLYPDLLNPETASRFIGLCHEFYKDHLSGHFGKTIPLIFLDESGVVAPPWTDGLAKCFGDTYGYDIIEKLPCLFSSGDPEGMQARIDYYDWWSQRLCGAFLEPLARWCQKSGLMFAGHFGGEDETIGSRVHGYGHILRVLRTLDIPGVDTIWRQIFPGERRRVKISVPKNAPYELLTCANHHFPKFASSVMHQKGLKSSVTESFAVYGEGLTLAQMRWIVNFQYVRGINLTTMGGTQYRAKGFDRVRQRPIFSPDNPSWGYMPLFHEYTARLSYLLGLGTPDISTALYFPVRDIWAGGPSMHRAIAENDRLAGALFEQNCDYDFIDDDLLADASAEVRGGHLHIGAMRYGTVYVGYTECMAKEAKDTLQKLAESGGRVIYVPEGAGDLGGAVHRTAVISPRGVPVTACKKIIGGGELYFLVNEGTAGCSCVLEVHSDKKAYTLNPENGDVDIVDQRYFGGGRWSIPLEFAFADAKILLFSAQAIDGRICRPPQTRKKITLDGNWSAARVKSHVIGEETHTVIEFAGECSPIDLGDWRDRFGGDFSGTVKYELPFEWEYGADSACELDLGEVKYYCEAELNGVVLGKRAWPPYAFDVTGVLLPGKSTLAVRVTNTFANQFAHTRAFDANTPSELSGYHYIAGAFEADSLPSGLFGPVTVTVETTGGDM